MVCVKKLDIVLSFPLTNPQVNLTDVGITVKPPCGSVGKGLGLGGSDCLWKRERWSGMNASEELNVMVCPPGEKE